MATRQYERRRPGSRPPFGNTDQGFLLCGEVKEYTSVAIAKAISPQFRFRNQGQGVKAPGVTGERPETKRSSPEQGEADHQIGGGPYRSCRTMRSDDFGLGVKGPSSLATAGSSRNWSKPCLALGSFGCRALIVKLGRRLPT